MTDKALSKAGDARSPALWKSIDAVSELVTGLMASDHKDWYLSAGHVLQRIRGGRFTEMLLKEINAYREKGRIKNDYFQTEQGQACLQELLNALDTDSPDEIRFKAMKAVLLTVASEEKSSRNDVLPQQLMRICRQLSSTEVLILTACYAVYQHNEWDEQITNDIGRFLPMILKRSGLQFDDLVYVNIDGLTAKRLIVVMQGGPPNLTFKLSRLGERLCQFIEAYS